MATPFSDWFNSQSFSDKPEQPIVVQEPEPIEFGKYSQNDLVKDKYFGTVRDYMQTRFGVDEFRGDDREEVVNKFLNNMRGFSGGNSVRTVGEVAFLNSLEDDSEELSTVGKAYELFENMAGVFSGETTAGERLEAVGDYARTTLADPVNLIGFGIGKLFTGAGSKGAAKLAQQAAIASYRRQLQKGVADDIAKDAANKVFTETFKKVSKDNAAKAVAKKEARDKIPDTIKNRLKSNSKEITANMAVEMAVNVGSAYAYEKGLVRTGVQEEVNKINLGLAGVGTMILGGVRFGTVALQKNKNALVQPDIEVEVPKKFDPREVLKIVQDEVPFTETLRDKALRAKELSDLDTDFFITFLMGDTEAGIKGMAQIFAEQGHVFIKRTPEDGVSNYVADVLKKTDPKIAKQFIKDFTKATGIKMTDLGDQVGKRKLNMETFADTFANKMRDQGRLMNAASQFAKRMGITREQAEGVPISDAAAALLGTDNKINIKDMKNLGWLGKKWQKVKDAEINKNIVDAQRKVIRLLVTAPSTSYLNLVGYGSAVGINTVTDAALALTHLGQAGVSKVFGVGKNAEESLRIFRQLANAQKQRLKNLMDTSMTYDAYMSIANKNPDALKQLTFAMNGGIEVDDALKKAFGGEIDYSKSMMGLQVDKGIDILQTINFVHGQDVLTKSQEFIYQLDKGLRLDTYFNKELEINGFNEFFTNPNAAKLMTTKNYLDVLNKAVYETQKATFALSYKDAGFVPKIIEEARDVAGLGLLIPFGRFFNNTIALMSDMSFATAALQIAGVKTGTQRGIRENLVRGAVGWGSVYGLAQNEMLNRELGLKWNESIDEKTGAVKDVKYDFPISHAKGLGRLMSYYLDGTSAPKEEAAEIIEVLGPGQLTRQLNQITEGLGNLTLTAVTNKGPEGDRARKEFFKPWSKIFSQAVSGSTRFLDPVNTAVGLARGSDFKMINRKEGSETLNNSLRYMDQIIAVVSGEDISEEKFNAATGKITLDAAKQLGYREVEMTDTKKMLSIIGRPTYLANLRTKSTEADNRFNNIFHEIIEHKASKLLRNPKFREGKSKARTQPLLDFRTVLVNAVLRDARTTTLTFMKRGVYDVDDIVLSKMIDIGSKYNWAKIDRGLDIMQEKSEEKIEFKDLTDEQLDTLEAYLKFEKRLEERAKRSLN